MNVTVMARAFGTPRGPRMFCETWLHWESHEMTLWRRDWWLRTSTQANYTDAPMTLWQLLHAAEL